MKKSINLFILSLGLTFSIQSMEMNTEVTAEIQNAAAIHATPVSNNCFNQPINQETFYDGCDKAFNLSIVFPSILNYGTSFTTTTTCSTIPIYPVKPAYAPIFLAGVVFGWNEYQTMNTSRVYQIHNSEKEAFFKKLKDEGITEGRLSAAHEAALSLPRVLAAEYKRGIDDGSIAGHQKASFQTLQQEKNAQKAIFDEGSAAGYIKGQLDTLRDNEKKQSRDFQLGLALGVSATAIAGISMYYYTKK